MSFNVGNFVSNAAKSPIRKIIDGVQKDIVSRVSSSVTSALSERLFNIGQSFESLSSLAALRADSVISNGSRDYSGFAGKCVERASASAVRSMASSVGLSTQSYSTKVSPQGKIAAQTYETQQNVDVFPPDIGKYQIRFDFMTYKKPTPFVPVTSDVNYSLVLPIPFQLTEKYDVEWGEESLEALGDISDALGRGPQSGAEIGASVLTAAGAQAARSLAKGSGIASKAMSALEIGLGVVPNPNIALAFRGPKMRDHDFSWKFSPTSPAESKLIQAMIKKLKAKMLSKVLAGNSGTSILGYPDMVKITLAPNQLYEFKQCVITNVTANYAPDGAPSFFKGTNLPTTISLRIAVKELEYFVSEERGLTSLEEVAETLKTAGTTALQSITGG